MPALLDLINGFRVSALIYVAAKLGIADLLGDASKSYAELARITGTDPDALRRILRGLVVLGVFEECETGSIRLTELGQPLRSSAPDSLHPVAILTGEVYVPAWQALIQSVKTGNPGFDEAHGVGVWEHRDQHPELGAIFNQYMVSSASRMVSGVVDAYDFSRIASLVDVGGGYGQLAAAIARRYPGVTAVIYDLPAVVEGARSYLAAEGLDSRCRVASGSFFDRIPGGADAYVLSRVLHDWDDERCAVILNHCRDAMDRTGRLLVIERVMPASASSAPPIIFGDLQMLAVTGGRERTEREYRALLDAAGFVLTSVHTSPACPCSVMEARPRPDADG